MKTHRSDILILGSGTAALATALKTADFASVILLTKEKAGDTNSAMAQGGIAAVMSGDDTFESHIRDTLIAGAGLCKQNVVENYVRQAPERIQDLLNWGVQFDVHPKANEEGLEIDLTREGGHSFRRILHFEDQTGLEIHRRLLKKALAHPNIQLFENHYAIDLLINKQVDPDDMGPTRCIGAYALNKNTNEVDSFTAKQTILATGGAGKVYLYTSNWAGASGDGIAMAYRAGARIANLEFMQFHPTCLYHPEARNFLITEALRGEGGELINEQGIAFMKKYHPLGSLAPRDVVARSIDAEMKKTGATCVFIDTTKMDGDFLRERFPHIYSKCKEYGIDMAKQPVPVVPAAHYLCGGVVTDVNGQTDISSLWAVGETACTGLHGANRLASNSLLECLTMAHNCSEVLREVLPLEADRALLPQPKPWSHPEESNDDEMIVIKHMWEEVRHLMWNYVGIVRSDKRLSRAKKRLKNILGEVTEYYSNMKIHSDILELRNLAIVADLSVECALRRKESRGINYNLDYPFAEATEPGFSQKPPPERQEPPKDTILVRGLI